MLTVFSLCQPEALWPAATRGCNLRLSRTSFHLWVLTASEFQVFLGCWLAQALKQAVLLRRSMQS